MADDTNDGFDSRQNQILAPLVLLQRWAAGDSIDAARIFGLMHGFESIQRLDRPTSVSEETQTLVEDILEEVDNDRLKATPAGIKSRLRAVNVDETVAAKVMHL